MTEELVIPIVRRRVSGRVEQKVIETTGLLGLQHFLLFVYSAYSISSGRPAPGKNAK